jgi:hypothetical protein
MSKKKSTPSSADFVSESFTLVLGAVPLIDTTTHYKWCHRNMNMKMGMTKAVCKFRKAFLKELALNSVL